MAKALVSKWLIAGGMGALVVAMAGPAYAAEPNAAPNASDPEIIVTGIRGSLQRNMDIKRAASGVVDAISAEDIGKFPDSNVADSLQRLPGISIQRTGQRGEANGVTVRGFGGDFNDTQFDGRHLSTASGNRAVDFTTIGSDFVSRMSVYKTPDVTLGSSAIGATLDVNLPKPFDRKGFQMAAKAAGTVQDRNGKVVPSGGLLLSNTFADDTVGLLGYVTYRRADTTSNQVFIPGWIGKQFNTCQVNAACTDAQLSNPSAPTKVGWFPQQIGANQVTTEDARIDGRIAFQWQANDKLLLTLDDNFSRQVLHQQSYGYGAWFNGDDLRNVKFDSNGTVTDFNQFGTPMDFNAGIQRIINQTNMFGANLKWEATDNLKFDFDAALSRSVLNPGNNGYNDNMDIGYGGSNVDPNGSFVSTPCTNGVCTRYSTILGANTGATMLGNSANYLPSIHDVGPAGNAAAFTNQAVIGNHVIVRGANYYTDLVKQFKAAGRWEQENLKIDFGVRYSEDKFHQESQNTFVNGTFARYAGYGAPSGRTGSIAPLPASIYQGIISTSGFMPGYSGNVAPALIKYDPYAVYKLLDPTGVGTAPAFDPSTVLGVKEQTYAGWLKVAMDADLAGMPFHFSAGLRDEFTHLEASAIGTLPVNLITVTTDPTLITVGSYTPQQAIIKTTNYNYLLPSFDAKLEVTSKLTLRADASRTLTRPALSYLKPNITLGTMRKGSLAASGGNASLKPYLSDNFDVAAEYYYKKNSYFAVNGFLKYISNFIVGGVSTQSINGVTDPFTGQVAQFQVNGKINGPDGVVKGVEIAWQHVFGDTGFGFNANATLVKTNRNFDTSDISGAAFAITGLANSANFVGFYDKHGLQARVAVNWRDSYLLTLGQTQGGTFGAEPVNVNQQVQVDASASYDITKQVTVFVEGTNLNNSTYSTYGRWSNQPLDTWSYGRRFVFGARFHY